MPLWTLTIVGLFYHVWKPAWIESHWHSIWLRARSHMTSHYTWGSMTTLHDFGGVLGRLVDTFFWALTISWSQLLAHMWSGPQMLWWQQGQLHLFRTRYCFILLGGGGVVSSRGPSENRVALQWPWLRKRWILVDLHFPPLKPLPILCDN